MTAQHRIIEVSDLLPKEFRVTMRLRNNRMILLREQRGMSAPQAAEAIGVSYGTYVRLEGLHLSPKKKDGDWRNAASKIAEFYRLTPDMLWPDIVLRVVDPTVSTQLDGAQMAAMLPHVDGIVHGLPAADPFDAFCSAEQQERLKAAMLLLTPIERHILKYRIDGKTLVEVGEMYKLSRERTRQLEARALQTLREFLEEPKSPWEQDHR